MFLHRGDWFHLCEGSHFQTDDGCIHMLLRNAGPESARNRSLYLVESRDNGESYSEPQALDFSDSSAKFYCMRLSDGRFAVIGNPDPGRNRCPLSIHLSEDGVCFDTCYDLATEELTKRFPGMYKGGSYGYPNAVEVDGVITVIVSICKEDVRVFRFALPPRR